MKTTKTTPPTAQTTTMMTMSSCAKKISQTYTYSNCSLLKHACKCRYMYMHMHMCIRTCMNQPYTFLIHWFVWTELAVEATGRSVGRRQSVLRTPVHAHIAQLRHLLHHNTTIVYLCKYLIKLKFSQFIILRSSRYFNHLLMALLQKTQYSSPVRVDCLSEPVGHQRIDHRQATAARKRTASPGQRRRPSPRHR